MNCWRKDMCFLSGIQTMIPNRSLTKGHKKRSTPVPSLVGRPKHIPGSSVHFPSPRRPNTIGPEPLLVEANVRYNLMRNLSYQVKLIINALETGWSHTRRPCIVSPVLSILQHNRNGFLLVGPTSRCQSSGCHPSYQPNERNPSRKGVALLNRVLQEIWTTRRLNYRCRCAVRKGFLWLLNFSVCTSYHCLSDVRCQVEPPWVVEALGELSVFSCACGDSSMRWTILICLDSYWWYTRLILLGFFVWWFQAIETRSLTILLIEGIAPTPPVTQPTGNNMCPRKIPVRMWNSNQLEQNQSNCCDYQTSTKHPPKIRNPFVASDAEPKGVAPRLQASRQSQAEFRPDQNIAF